MHWPETPTCHNKAPFADIRPIAWEMRSDEHFRRCNYCGAVHPEDLLAAIAAGGRLTGSDWKYGWPHKFYVEVPNPTPTRQVVIGSRSYFEGQERKSSIEYGDQGTIIHAKWYNQHLSDAGYDEEAFQALVATLHEHAGIRFWLDEGGKLNYHAPRFGYQRTRLG